MIELINEPVGFFLLIMSIILITPLLSARVHLPGIVGIILGGMLIGPHGLGLLNIGDRIEFLSTIGLVYLMFSAGLEVDIHQFFRVRNRALVFGLVTFITPQLFGMALGVLLNLDWLGMILLGSAFASHTLIAFPILTQMGMTRNEAVAVTSGATVLTDIGAFIILAVVLGARSGELEILYFFRLILLIVIFSLLIIFGLPRIGKLFFRRFTSRAAEFQFVLVVLFVSALGAGLIGVHEVVGAFLAGLAINATLPRHSPVSGHVLFMGESFFIPVFLLYSGMMTNPWLFLQDKQTTLAAFGVTLVAYSSKFVAAWITGRIFKYSRAEFWITYGLSHAQAAVTIPTLVIGLEHGLFNSTLFNAAILMILLTSITSPLLVQRYALKLNQEEEESQLPMYSRILVPITNPQSQENLLTLASLLAHAGHGKLMVLNVVQEIAGQPVGLQHQKELLRRVPDILKDPDTEVELIPRLANSITQGILYTSTERNASLIVMGWRGKRTLRQSVLGTVLDEVIWGSNIPVIVGKLSQPLNGSRRVVLVFPAHVVATAALRRTMEANFSIAKALNVPLFVMADRSYIDQVELFCSRAGHELPCKILELKQPLKGFIMNQIHLHDLLVMPGFGSRQRFLSSVGNLAERLATTFSGNMIILHFGQ